MLGAIKYNLAHLLDFTGRDARQTFWFYVLFLFLVYFALGMIGGIVMVGSLMGPVFEAAEAGLSEQEMQVQLSQQMGAMMGQAMRIMLWLSVGVNALFDLLLAASFVRRLHDSNHSGWWALAVLASQAAGVWAMIPMIDMMQEFMTEAMNPANMADPAAMQAMIARQSQMTSYSAVGWLGPLIVIVFGVLDSTSGPNRFGEAPVRF